ncbi:beta-glucosidase 47 [Perilla frutescens var. hirtella]|nr:beta-glucosidase 47 [Perilla frutescens var. hirtella]
MRDLVGSMLPVFSEKDVENMINDELDFIGINHYTSFYSKDCIYSECEFGAPGVSRSEGYSLRTAIRDGQLIGQPTAVDWLYVYPQGMKKIITYIKDRYNNTPMFITENGIGLTDDLNSSLINDFERVEYMSSYFDYLTVAMIYVNSSADVRGYFAWSLLDNFEWLSGFTIRFGLHHVDFDSLNRTPKSSASWYKQLIQTARPTFQIS